LNRWFDHEEMKWVHTEILFEENKIFMKELAATYRVKNAFLTNNELI